MNFQVAYQEKQRPVAGLDPVYALIMADTNLGMRDRIIKLQAAMIEAGGAEGDSLPLDHQFAPGTYARTIFMPKGSFVIGKIHRRACVNIISKGRATVWTEYGEKQVEAPAVWVSDPGTQRVVLNHEDVVWTCVHQNPDNLTDLEAMEEQTILPDYSSIPIIESEPEMQTIGGE